MLIEKEEKLSERRGKICEALLYYSFLCAFELNFVSHEKRAIKTAKISQSENSVKIRKRKTLSQKSKRQLWTCNL